MQDPKNSHTRKRWYQKAMDRATHQWKTISKPSEIHATTTTTNSKLWKNTIPNNSKSQNQTIPGATCTVWKAVSRHPGEVPIPPGNGNRAAGKLRKCTSLRVATSFTRVCLCAPISSYNEVFRADVPPRRSNSYPRSKPFPGASSAQERTISTYNNNYIAGSVNTVANRLSTEGRRVFRGKSLTDDVLMRRFVVEEEAMMQVRRRNQMEVIRKRSMMRRKKLGPSPLRRMILAEEEQDQEQQN